jgi:hypothetical protein
MRAPPISNVSDTARWVAVYRARESARPDALFQDPFAQLLAGEQGQAMAGFMPRQARNGWPMIARTKLMDDLIMATIEQGCDCVASSGEHFRRESPAQAPMLISLARGIASKGTSCQSKKSSVPPAYAR